MLLHQRIRRESGPEQMETITSPANAAGGGCLPATKGTYLYHSYK